MKTPKNLLHALLLVCLAAMLPLSTLMAAPPSGTTAPSADRRPVIVQLTGEPAALYQARLYGSETLSAATAERINAYTAQLTASQARFLADAQAAGLTLMVKRQYTYVFNGLAVEAAVDDLPALTRLPGVKAVYPDHEKRVVEVPPNVTLIGAPDVWAMTDPAGQPVTGKNMRIAIIDTGIDYNHPDLGGGFGPGYKVYTGWNFINNTGDPLDDHDHGTHCAGIAAANGTLKGVAPDARLMAYKVFNDKGEGQDSDIIAAIERAANPDGDPATDDAAHVLSMSFGGPGNAGDPLSQAVDAASALGIVAAVAAGNEGPDIQTVTSPGVAHSAITVGASDNADVLADFSSRGPVMDNSWAIKPDLLAPGVNITSTVRDGKYDVMSGTSMATPHIAGAAALLRQLHPDWAPGTVKAALMQTAKDLGHSPFYQGGGRVQVDHAALAPGIILPASLSLGADDLTQPQWSRSEVLGLTNLATTTLTYTLAISANLPAGVNLALSTEQLVVPPGQTRNAVFFLTVDNSVVPNVNDPPYAYDGAILAQSAAGTLRVPFAFVKRPILNVFLEDEDLGMNGAIYVLVHDRANFQEDILYPPEAFGWPLAPGVYDVMAIFDVANTHSGRGERILVREQVPVGTRTDLHLRTLEATHAVKLDARDQNGNPIQLSQGHTVAVLTYIPPQPITETIRLPAWPSETNTWYFSTVSQDYRLDVFGMKQLFWTLSTPAHTFFGQQRGIFSDVTFAPSAGAYRLVRHPLRLPAAVWGDEEGQVTVVEFHQPWVGVLIPFLFFDRVMPADWVPFTGKAELPGAFSAYYAAAPDWNAPTGYLGRGVLGREQYLYIAAIRRQPDGLLHGYNQDLSLELYATDAEEIPFGLNPPHWFGRFANTPTQLTLGSLYNPEKGPFFMTQWSDIATAENLPYAIYHDGSIVLTGAVVNDVAGDPVMATLPASGVYSFTLPFTYTLGVTNVVTGVAHTTAQFDTSQADADPPTMINLWLTAGGTPTDEPYGSPEVRVVFTDTVGVVSATLAYNAGAGWNDVPLTLVGNEHRGSIPAQPPKTQVALRLRAADAAGNSLTYELSPGYVQAPYRIWLPVIYKNAAP